MKPPMPRSSTRHKARSRKKGTLPEQDVTDQTADRSVDSAAQLLAFTIDPSTARIVKLEGFDAAGARHELSDAEKASLLERRRQRTLEQVVERAFEAGIACVLDDENGREDPNETLDDVELTHRLLVPLIEHSDAKRLIARDTLDRAILDTLIEHSMTSSTAAGGNPEAEAR